MNWQKFEDEVFSLIVSHYRGDVVLQNHKIKGKYSKRSRQLDIFISQKTIAGDYITVIDSKNYNKRIDVKTVEAFISMMEDVGADYGIIVSEKGFTKSAFNRAFNNPKGIDLDILDFAQVTNQFQGEGAIPYDGSHGAVVQAPFGWIVDATRRQFPVTCFLYKKGLTFEEAEKIGEYGYINFWGTQDSDVKTIQALSVHQEAQIGQDIDVESSELIPASQSNGQECLARITKASNIDFIELAGYVLFDDFIFFCIFHTPSLFSKRNFRKLQLLLKNVLPLNIVGNV